jgi:hypothetical protein
VRLLSEVGGEGQAERFGFAWPGAARTASGGHGRPRTPTLCSQGGNESRFPVDLTK